MKQLSTNLASTIDVKTKKTPDGPMEIIRKNIRLYGCGTKAWKHSIFNLMNSAAAHREEQYTVSLGESAKMLDPELEGQFLHFFKAAAEKEIKKSLVAARKTKPIHRTEALLGHCIRKLQLYQLKDAFAAHGIQIKAPNVYWKRCRRCVRTMISQTPNRSLGLRKLINEALSEGAIEI